MTKNILLAASAITAIGFAGGAHAQSLTWSATDSTVPAYVPYLDTATVPALTGTTSYLLATEANPAAFVNAQAGVTLTHALSAGSTLPSGNVVLTVTVTNATFGTGTTLAANRVTGNGTFTVAPTTFVAGNPAGIPTSGASTRSYIVSSAGGAVDTLNLDLPIVPAINGSPVVVTSTFRTENGNVIDSAVSLTIINYANAFQFSSDPVIGAGAINRSVARLNPAENTLGNLDDPYVEFVLSTGAGAVVGTHDGLSETAAIAQIGTVTIDHNLGGAPTYYDLEGSLTDPADVTRVSVVVNGDTNAYNNDGDGTPADLGFITIGAEGNYAVNSAGFLFDTDATVAALDQAAFLDGQASDIFASDLPVRLTADGDEIRRSDYNVVASYAFNQTVAYQNADGVPYYRVSETGTGDLESITRQGTTVIVPWTVSRTLNGNMDTIRIGNLKNVATGPVLVQVRNIGVNGAGVPLSGTGYVDAGAVQVAPSIDANGELQITSAQLGTLLGDYGRGDVEVTIEALQGEVTVRRFRRDANNNWSEVNSGTVAADQNYDEQP